MSTGVGELFTSSSELHADDVWVTDRGVEIRIERVTTLLKGAVRKVAGG